MFERFTGLELTENETHKDWVVQMYGSQDFLRGSYEIEN